MSNLRALHEAATPAPWVYDPDNYNRFEDDGERGGGSIRGDADHHSGDGWYIATMERDLTESEANHDLIVRLRNDYASGDLIEREKVEALVEVADAIAMFPHDGRADDLVALIVRLRAALEAMKEKR